MQENMSRSNSEQDLKEKQKKTKKILEGENICHDIENYLCFGCINGDRVGVYRKYMECFYEYSGKKVEYSLY